MKIEVWFDLHDMFVGLYWKTERKIIDCDDPQCGDSSWDHPCNAGGETWRHIWVLLVPCLPIHISWEIL